MKRHLAYLKDVLRHKWFVFLACRKVGASPWCAITHDLGKFRPCEWITNAYSLYEVNGEKKTISRDKIDTAMTFHQSRNPHHWQYWLLKKETGNSHPVCMPESLVREMIADWMGTCREHTGKWTTYSWWMRNKQAIQLHPETIQLVEDIIYSKCAPGCYGRRKVLA